MPRTFCRTTEFVINIINRKWCEKHLNKALLDKLHHQIQTAYIHFVQIESIKLTFDHKINTSPNYGTCVLANGYMSENAMKKQHKY